MIDPFYRPFFITPEQELRMKLQTDRDMASLRGNAPRQMVRRTIRDMPIIFSTPMIRALFAGRKTMTRRLALRHMTARELAARTLPEGVDATLPTVWQGVLPGDRLWVREGAHIDGAEVNYMADHSGDPKGLGWRPSIHMPRWASRLTLIVTDARMERLQDISQSDAEREGVSGVEHFQALWDRLHGEGAWDQNPEVIAIGFRITRANIDKLKERNQTKSL